MPQNTRSGLQRERQTPPISLRRSRRSHASRASYREGDSQRRGQSPEKKLGHTSAAFSPLGTPLKGTGRDHETPTPTHRPDRSSPSKRHDAIKDPISTPNLQGAHQTVPQRPEGETQPGHVRIIHYDHSKYQPSTPGSEKHPIKIEDSPSASLLLPTGSRSIPISQELAAPRVSRPDTSATHGNTSYIEKGRTSGNLFITPPADLVLSAAATSIISSPKAATAFLYCFLTAEEYWLRSCDHDMDPDIKFWKTIAAKFNADRNGYRVDIWSTARAVAVTLCSGPYLKQVQELSVADAELLPFISAIQDCRHMSHRRRRAQLKVARALIGDMVVEENLHDNVLERKPRTLEDRTELLEALSLKAAQSGYSHPTEANRSKVGSRPKEQDTGTRAYPQPYTMRLDGALAETNGMRVDGLGNVPRGPKTMRWRRNGRTRGQGRNEPRGGHSYPPTSEGRGSRRDEPLPIYGQQDRQRLEARVAQLEEILRDEGWPRHSR